MKNIYLNSFILSYNNIQNLLTYLEKNYNNKFFYDTNICKTNFNYKVKAYKIGNGKKHIILFGCTHVCEIITVYFILEFILTLLQNDTLYDEYCSKYTFHFIPILNPEGYIISSCNVLANLSTLNNEEIEKFATNYLQCYEQDDYLALQGKCIDKKYKKAILSSISNISDLNLQKSVKKILKDCKLTENVLPVWSSNGVGVDINSNSIHKFNEIKKLRLTQKCGKLRYNDIPVTVPSPMSYPGNCTFDKRVPENLGLYKYIKSIYSLKDYSDERLISIFSYHSTGGEIYGFPDLQYANKKQIDIQSIGMTEYSNYTNYSPINEKLKYGVMDFYRVALDNVCSLTIELSKVNANPIGFLSNINSFLKEIIDNKKAVLATINKISALF